jgi:hypothetical protein
MATTCTHHAGQPAQRLPQRAARLGQDHIPDLGLLGHVSNTALTADRTIAFAHSGLPNTFAARCNSSSCR